MFRKITIQQARVLLSLVAKCRTNRNDGDATAVVFLKNFTPDNSHESRICAETACTCIVLPHPGVSRIRSQNVSLVRKAVVFSGVANAP